MYCNIVFKRSKMKTNGNVLKQFNGLLYTNIKEYNITIKQQHITTSKQMNNYKCVSEQIRLRHMLQA